MTNLYDRASEREAEFRAAALAEQQRRAGFEGKTIDDSAVECRVCEEPIPIERRHALLGVQTCVDCQTELERAANPIVSSAWSIE